jgi:glycosyltransferase involved in cell wall biosynthesis
MTEAVPGLLSVLIPTYNAARYLAETIDSVLAERWERLEILVVDDGSEDRSVEIAQGFGSPVRSIRRPHFGLAATRNAAVAAARGEFLLHLDGDDLLVPSSIGIRMSAFSYEPALEIVVGRLSCFFSPDLDADQRSRLQLPAEPQQGHLPGTSIIRAAAFKQYGDFDEQFSAMADLDWFVRARDAGARLHYLSDVVVHRRVHGANMSLTMKQATVKDRLRLLKNSLNRRRAGERST